MKHLLAALLVAACGGSPAPAPVKPTPPTTFVCGDKTCTDAQICIETNIGPGTPPPDGGAHISTSYQCAATPLTGGGWGCGMVDAHHQTCEALIPAAPHG